MVGGGSMGRAGCLSKRYVVLAGRTGRSRKQTKKVAAVTIDFISPCLTHQHNAGLVIYREDAQVTHSVSPGGASKGFMKISTCLRLQFSDS